jgi:anti-sigma regulatory factor (Ser/Thr protein kinase)
MARKFEATLPRIVDAPQAARRLVREWLPEDLDGETVQSAELLVSELVTNAVVHGRGRLILRGELDDDRLLVEVIDDGDGFERTVRQRGVDSVGGRGLAIVDALASRWGIHEGTTHVWFELERPGPRLGVDRKPT